MIGRSAGRREGLLSSGAGNLAGIAILGTVLSVILGASTWMSERQSFQAELFQSASERALAIERELNLSLGHVEAIGALVSTLSEVDRSEIQAFTEAMIQHGQPFEWLGYARLARDGDRGEHEAETREEGPDGDEKRQSRSGGGGTVATERSFSVPLQVVAGPDDRSALVGIDLAADPVIAEALGRARSAAELVLTRRIPPSDDAPGSDVLAALPVFQSRQLGVAAAEPRRLHGFAVGMLNLKATVGSALDTLKPAGIHFLISDDLVPDGRDWLHLHLSRTVATADLPEGNGNRAPPWRMIRSFEIGDRRWSIWARPTLAYLSTRGSWTPFGASLAGLLATGLLVGFVSRQRSTHRLMRQAQEEQHRAERRLADLGRVIDESHDEIYVFDADSLRFVHVNRGAINNSGYSRRELYEMTPLDLKLELEPDAFAELLRPLREQTRSKIQFTTRHTRKDGSLYDVEVHIQASEYDGQPVFLGVLLDITYRKALEARLRQSQRIDSLGTLAGGIAHDFNNLLTAITGFTDLALLEEGEDSPIRGYLQEIAKASDRARTVVRRILTFSRRGTTARRPVDLARVAAEILCLLRVSLPPAITLRERLTAGTIVQGDATQIHQLLLNLCTNALHAMRATGGTLKVSVDSVELSAREADSLGALDAGLHRRITVRDTGHGIEPEIREKIFDPFFTTKGPDEGTGMGLAMVHAIVSGHEGAVRCRSSVGDGTVFEVFLPAAHAVPDSERGAEADSPLGTETILVVDDEPANVRLFADMLRRSGYRIVTASNAKEALETVESRSEPVDLVVTDFMMPGQTGLDLATHLSAEPGAPPVVMISGYGEVLDRELAASAGVRAVLSKPVRMPELAKSVREVLDAARADDGGHP